MYDYRVQKPSHTTDQEKPVSNRTGIPTPMKEQYEEAGGLSLEAVRVHYHSERPAQLRAYAYTQGEQVYLGPGQEKFLPHELGHVIQQKQGLVRPTGQVNGLPINTDETLERDADHAGTSRCVSASSNQASSLENSVIQGTFIVGYEGQKPTKIESFLDLKVIFPSSYINMIQNIIQRVQRLEEYRGLKDKEIELRINKVINAMLSGNDETIHFFSAELIIPPEPINPGYLPQIAERILVEAVFERLLPRSLPQTRAMSRPPQVVLGCQYIARGFKGNSYSKPGGFLYEELKKAKIVEDSTPQLLLGHEEGSGEKRFVFYLNDAPYVFAVGTHMQKSKGRTIYTISECYLDLIINFIELDDARMYYGTKEDIDKKRNYL